MKVLDNIPLMPLILVAVMLGLAPFPMQPEPHLIEKLRLLIDGNLSRPIDIFDLFLHSAPLIILTAKLVRRFRSVEAR